MFLFNVLIFLETSVYFDFVNSFTGSNILVSRFKKNIGQLVGEQPHQICNTTKLIWGSSCENVFQNLRNNELYRNSLYVNYEAINKAMHPLCKRNKLSNPGLKQQFQWMLSCPGREAIVQNNVPFERYEFYNEIHIYPESNLKIKSGEENAMMVFQYIQSTDTYTLLEIYDNLIWNSQNLVVNQLLNVPPPTAFDDAETVNKIKLYKETFDKFSVDFREKLCDFETVLQNVVREADGEVFAHLCLQFYKRPKYKDQVVSRWFRNDSFYWKPFPELLNVKSGMQVVTYSCHLYDISGENKLTTDFKVGAGLDATSVILIKKEENYNKILEYIENVNLKYYPFLF